MRETSFIKKLKVAALGSAMADMAMLLLIFFMATTTTEPPKGVEVKVPSGTTEAAEQDSIYVSVSIQGDYYYDGNKVTLGVLADSLATRQGEKDHTVAITADRGLDYSTISALLDVLREQDFLNVVFMAEDKHKQK